MLVKARRAALLVAAAALTVPPASGQSEGLSGYVQTVPVSSRAGDATVFNRVRVARALALGPLSLDVAHEVSAVLARAADPALGAVAGSGARDGQWLNLQWVLSDRGRMRAQHRFDRLQAVWSPAEEVVLSVGRQAVSWGTTLLLTPADPFLPFRPEDPFREFRGGIDAARLRFYPGPLTEIDLVIRPSRLGGDEELTALARGLTSWGSWEVSGWGGVLYGDGAAAVAAAGGVGEWAARLEAVIREVDGRAVSRGALGVERTLELGGREARFVLELQRDGLGAAGPDELETLPDSRAFRRGELLVRGREEFAARAAYRIHPLWNVFGTALWNLSRGGTLLAPGFSYSLADEATVKGGAYLDMRRRIPGDSGGEEGNGRPTVTGYLSLTWYF